MSLSGLFAKPQLVFRRIHRPAQLVLACLVFSALPGRVGAADYYVASNGNDTNDGSANSPFREIRKPLTLVVPGDRILVADGSYKGFDVVDLGATGQPIFIKALGSNVVITPTTDRGSNNPNNIVVWNSIDVVLDGLRSFNASNAGIRIVFGSGITVRNGVFGNNARWGIVTSHSDDLLIENNECYGSQIEHGIYVANSGDRPIVRGNKVHDNVGSGLRANGDVSQGGDGLITGALFENNIIYNNGSIGGAAMNFDGLQDGIIRNNLLYNNHSSGIALFKGGGADGPKGMQIYHNTIDMAADARYVLRITDTVGSIIVRNNILYNRNTAKGPFSWNTTTDASNTDSDYNAFGGGAYVSTDGETTRIALNVWIASGHEPHSVPSATLTNLFADTAGADYRLVLNALAIDRGLTLAAVPMDILGFLRPRGSSSEIGAYEFTPYDAWKADNGIAVSTQENVDLDGDGIPILLEYAFGLDPRTPGVAGLPAHSINNGRLQLTYSRTRSDVSYDGETSTDLQLWTTAGVDQGDTGPVGVASVPFSGGRQFLRLRITRH